MKKIAVIACVLLLFASVSCRKSATEINRESSSYAEDVAPNFNLRDTAGRQVSLADFRGKVVLLEFWATWCPPCRATIPELTAVQEKYLGKGLVVIGVSLDEGGDVPLKLTAFAKEFKINYRLLIGDEETERAYKITSIPTLFLIDRQGKVVTSYIGYVDDLAASLSQQLKKVI